MAVFKVTVGPVGAVLAIDTAAPVVGVSVVARRVLDEEPVLIFEWSDRVIRKADSVILPAVAEALLATDAAGVPLLGVAVSVGPGTFTGLRVGLAAALGVAVAREVEVFPCGSLDARALLSPTRPLLVLLDARKRRFYGRWYAEDGPLGVAEDAPLEQFMGGEGVAVGEGAVVAADILKSHGLEPMADSDRCPAPLLARAALDGRLTSVDAAEVHLRYVRPPDAKRPSHVLKAPRHGG